MERLYFTRHGLSQLNQAEKYSGTIETPLVKIGREQAKLAGQHAKSLNIDYILSSPLSRAIDTAKIIARIIGLKSSAIEINSLLIERHFGVMEGQAWIPDLDIDGFADVETTDSLFKRAQLALEHIENGPGNNILIVSHGGFGRALRHVINPSVPFKSPDNKFKNAEIVQLI